MPICRNRIPALTAIALRRVPALAPPAILPALARPWMRAQNADFQVRYGPPSFKPNATLTGAQLHRNQQIEKFARKVRNGMAISVSDNRNTMMPMQSLDIQ